jgi:flagellum-specific ATP synthase
MGAYVQGADRELDTAIRLWPSIEKYLRQGLTEKNTMSESVKNLRDIVGFDVR